MKNVTYDARGLKQWITDKDYDAYQDRVAEAETALQEKTGEGADFLGWLQLPQEIDKKEVARIKEVADTVRGDSDICITIGIGGSYLGAKATIEFLGDTFEDTRKPRVIFLGHQVNSDYLADLLHLIEGKDVTVNVISKSGTTTEPGIAFRVIREWMESRYGPEEASRRIIATTDPDKGALRTLADTKGYATFAIPPDVGGRFSVLTPVGLLPIALAGFDIEKLIEGAEEAMELCGTPELENNPAAQYAAARTILFRRGKVIEVMAGFQPQLHYVSEWWKQLAGESEGKDGAGVFPAAVDYTTDLHSLGQWMQEGVRNVFETFVILDKTRSSVTVPGADDDLDGLNYLAGKSFEEINQQAANATFLAHLAGGVPASIIRLADRSERTLGQLFYFFEKAIALSGYLLRVNPFNQPGVEAYKKNMFALLHKPGFEQQGEKLRTQVEKLGL